MKIFQVKKIAFCVFHDIFEVSGVANDREWRCDRFCPRIIEILGLAWPGLAWLGLAWPTRYTPLQRREVVQIVANFFVAKIDEKSSKKSIKNH